MTDRKTMMALMGLALLAILLSSSMFVVKETERALMLQFGRIVRPDIPPGIHWKLPIINQVKKFDARVLTVDGAAESFFTIERKRLIVDSFAKWRIADVETYYKATGGVELATQSRLADRINDGLRNEFGTRTLHEVVSGERDQLMLNMTKTLSDSVKKSLGVEVLDVRVRRIDLPPEVSDQVFQRMAAERDKEAQELRAIGLEAAEKIRAEADRQVTIIAANAYGEAEQTRGEGDATAARIYATAYQRDPEFYAFTRSLKAYRAALTDRNGVLVLEPDSDFFRYLKTPDGSKK
ncbi:MAG: protease modulator HflC [Porticoccaceae bacterium]